MSVPPDDPIPSGSEYLDRVAAAPPRLDDSVPSAIGRLDLVSPGPPQYEFTPAQGETIADLAHKMRFVGLLLLLSGLLTPLVNFLMYRILPINVTFLLMVLIGALTFRAGGEFKAVVATQGKDINHLMGALEYLRRIYGFFYYFVIIGVIVSVVLLIWALFGGPGSFTMGGGSPVLTK